MAQELRWRIVSHFAEKISAEIIGKNGRKSDISWKQGIWLGSDTEADEIIVVSDSGVVKCVLFAKIPPHHDGFQIPLRIFRRCLGVQGLLKNRQPNLFFSRH